jgi:hypothetical protein
MKFGQLEIGDVFFSAKVVSDSVDVLGNFFKKKSLSSAYIMDPARIGPAFSRRLSRKDNNGSFCGFAPSVEVVKVLSEEMQ